ncbi:hypothetical protein RJ640_026094 [Escallonia rubra]|uniref:CCHC-type domain-containing protein n=1 Tax=Escallonia rubra TaxID=112253 RepID=A0AA88RGK5_9ASTE|nr:hypothetical protein RJ640_026094 [Escallonia rubra]
MSNNTTMKYVCEQFDGKTNFGIWQSTVKDILVQQGLLKPLLGNKPESMDQDDWEELQAKAVSTIRGRSRSRNPGHGKDRSKSRGKQDKSSIECWYCKKIGHIARRCPERKEKKNGKKHVNNANVAEEDDKSSDGDLYLVSSVEQQEGGVMKVSKGAMVIMKGQKIGNLYKLIGNTVIGGASVSTHVGSSNDNSELWHKRLGHLSEGGEGNTIDYERRTRSNSSIHPTTLRQVRTQVQPGRNRVQTLPGQERVRHEQPVSLRNPSVPTRAVHRHIQPRIGIRYPVRVVAIEPLQPRRCRQVGVVRRRHLLIRVARPDIVAEDVAQELAVDAVARERHADPDVRLDAVLIRDLRVVTQDVWYRAVQYFRYEGEVRLGPNVVRPECEVAASGTSCLDCCTD